MQRPVPARLWQIPILLLIMVSLACNVGLPSFFATPTPTPQPLPPTIIETVPPVGSELPLQSQLLVYFSEAMDRASVDAALTSDFAGGFLFNWMDDSTLSLTPKSALPADGRVNFTLAVSARSASGLALLEPQAFSYRVTGPLRVTQVLPAAQAKDVSPDSAVVVSFNQPIVPLGADAAGLPPGLSIEPAAQGKGEWLNTSTYIFYAAPVLAGGTDYIVRVNPQLVSTSGAALEANSPNAAWAFRTSFPAIQEVKPKDTDGELLLDPKLQLTFNQPMDRASVEANFAFSGPGGKAPGTFEWNEKSTVVTFKPSALLERATQYVLTLGRQSLSRGGAPLGTDTSIAYQTFSRFGISYSNFGNGETRPQNTNNISITFAAPVAEYKPSELSSLVTVSPEPLYVSLGRELESTINIYGQFSPGKTYKITFSGKLKDRWGQALGQDYIFTFREPDAAPSISFGSYLPALFVRPEQPVVNVQAVNIHRLNISRGTFSLDDFLRYSNEYEFSQTYIPADLQTRTENIDANLNSNAYYPVNFSQDGSPLTPGLYYINVTSDEVRSTTTNTGLVLLASNLNLALKTSATDLLVWATDLRTQTPVAGQALTIYDEKGSILASGTTDANGLWQGQIPETAVGFHTYIYAVLGRPGDDLFGMAVSNWDQQLSPWSFGLPLAINAPQHKFYLYTERPIYRPGDTIHYRGVIRQGYNGRYTDARLSQVNVSLSGNSKIAESKLDISPYGTFNGEFSLSASAVPGFYSIAVDDETSIYGNALYFNVADYRKPEINLAVALSSSPALSGQALTGKVSAAYFFGAPVSDLPFKWTLSRQPSYFSIPQFETGVYQTSWYSDTANRFGEPISQGEGRTGADGTFNIQLDNIKTDSTAELTLEITASESGGFPVSARDAVTMHPASFYIGIRPNAWFIQSGAELGFDLLSADWDQKAVPNKALTASLQKVEWQRKDSFYSYSFTPTYTLVDSKPVTTDADGKGHVAFTPAQSGTYMLEVSGDGATSQVLVWVGGTQDASWPNLPYQHIVLTADKKKYNPGENAGVFIPNPFGVPASALVTTERSTIISAQIVSVPADGLTFKLPLSDDQAPNVYLSATLLGPGNDFRQGYVNLPVEASAFTLNVDLKATPEKAKPGDKLTLDLKVTDSKGQPVQAEFSMAVVDLAALALADPNAEEIVPAFYTIQPLGVSTSLTDAVAADRLLPQPPGGSGGGGGDDTLTLREKFPDTAYWKADIVTDAQGQAQVTLTLPDSLTTWQVDGIGLSKDTKVGQARVRVVTSKELLIRPQTPRFLVVGDKAQLTAIVNNTTSSALEGTASLQASGFSLDDPATTEQKISIPANGRIQVSWSGLVQAGDAVDAVFSVNAGGLQDASRPNDGRPIPVLRYTASQTFSTAGILADAATRQEIIAVPRTFQPLGGKLDLELSPSLAAVVLSSLEARKTSPDELSWSSELLVSDFLPDLVTYQILKEAGVSNPALEAKLKGSVADDVRRLLVSQNYISGGWSWMADPNTEADPYITAYVLFGLNQVARSGLLDIEMKDTLQRGHDYLVTAAPMDDKSDLSVPWIANRVVFQNYVLQQLGGANAQYVDQAYANRDRLDPWAKALLAETLYSISPTDQRARDLLSNLQAGALRSASGAHWENISGDGHNPGTPLFTTALVVYSLAQRDAANPLLADAVRYLASQRNATGRWASSYETAWVILALDQTMKATGELRGGFNFSAALNGAVLANGQASGPENIGSVTATAPLTQLNLRAANALLVSRDAGPGRLYYRAALTVDRPVESAPALEQGIAVSRKFLSCTGKDCRAVTSYQMQPDASGRVKVQLTVTLPHDAYYLMVQDYIPAGADLLDSSLKTSQQVEQSTFVETPAPAGPQYDNADPFGEGWGWWYFNDPRIYSDHILWSADYVPAGTYLLSYTIVPSLPGQYQVLPAHAWQAYFPEVQGTSAGTMFEIKP